MVYDPEPQEDTKARIDEAFIDLANEVIAGRAGTVLNGTSPKEFCALLESAATALKPYSGLKPISPRLKIWDFFPNH